MLQDDNNDGEKKRATRLKAIMVGLGSSGFSWYKRLRDRGLLLAVVETGHAMKEKMGNDPFPF
ncbi:hypothetical protein RB620_22530 [Paenibacillus sp. LHD-117]|uniref:hypothetical protein n=1 Tax=Paenibacillus sp. LHD-117 TaxID=3071412 RepID=UPI0027E095CA|nr:hypothetical protein [Paenibacillus sp. LHD-117]MDQ6422210.1 hypothetical protein [Paenibacillus sp. LHD-117]